MRKILTIARREFRAMVATRAFLIGVTLMPIMMLAGLLLPNLLRNVGPKQREIVVLDRTGVLFPVIEQAAQARTQMLERLANSKDEEQSDNDESQTRWDFVEAVDVAEGDEGLYALSEQARAGEIYAFLVILPNVLDPPPHAEPQLVFYSQDSAVSDVRRWIGGVLNSHLRGKRLAEAGLDPQVVDAANAFIEIEAMGLLDKDSQGQLRPAVKADVMKTIFLPFGVMMLMFAVIMISVQPMLDSVMEEKTERIAEVLLGSASPSQLMFGKLLGNVAGSLSVVVLYLGGAYIFATRQDWIDLIPRTLFFYFIIYQVLAVFFFSSLYMAIGSAVSRLKEAQGMVMPVMMMMMSPMFVWFNALRDPNGAIAAGFSFFPPSAPMMMMLRLATGAQVPTTHIVGSLIIMVVSTLLVVWFAGRIFRVGILWRGKTPTMAEMLKWAWL